MAAIDRLNTALSALNLTVGRLATSVDRVVEEIAKLRTNEPAIENAAVGLEALNGVLTDALGKLNVAVPPPPEPEP